MIIFASFLNVSHAALKGTLHFFQKDDCATGAITAFAGLLFPPR